MASKDPDGEIEKIGKPIEKNRNQNFCDIQVIVFDLGYLPVAADLLSPNLSVFGFFQFHRRDPMASNLQNIHIKIPHGFGFASKFNFIPMGTLSSE